MTFKPWVLVVKAGQVIHIYNGDSMTHGFYPGDVRGSRLHSVLPLLLYGI